MLQFIFILMFLMAFGCLAIGLKFHSPIWLFSATILMSIFAIQLFSEGVDIYTGAYNINISPIDANATTITSLAQTQTVQNEPVINLIAYLSLVISAVFGAIAFLLYRGRPSKRRY